MITIEYYEKGNNLSIIEENGKKSIIWIRSDQLPLRIESKDGHFMIKDCKDECLIATSDRFRYCRKPIISETKEE